MAEVDELASTALSRRRAAVLQLLPLHLEGAPREGMTDCPVRALKDVAAREFLFAVSVPGAKNTYRAVRCC